MKFVLSLIVLSFLIQACQPIIARGPRGYQGPKGDMGEQGPQGPEGPQGESGQSCSILKLGNITNITCGDSTVQVFDGEDGQNGTSVQTISLCPEINNGTFNEYLLLINNEYYGVYSSNNNIGLTKLHPGDWTTTDGRQCKFTITDEGNLEYSSSVQKGEFTIITETTCEQWPNHMQIRVNVKNVSNNVLQNWKVKFTLPEGQSLYAGFEADYSVLDQSVVVNAPNYHKNLQVNEVYSFGYQVQTVNNCELSNDYELL